MAGKRGTGQISTRGNVTDGKLCDQEVTTRIGKRTEWNQIEHPIGCDAHAVHLWFALTNETISGLSFCERVRKASRGVSSADTAARFSLPARATLQSFASAMRSWTVRSMGPAGPKFVHRRFPPRPSENAP